MSISYLNNSKKEYKGVLRVGKCNCYCVTLSRKCRCLFIFSSFSSSLSHICVLSILFSISKFYNGLRILYSTSKTNSSIYFSVFLASIYIPNLRRIKISCKIYIFNFIFNFQFLLLLDVVVVVVIFILSLFNSLKLWLVHLPMGYGLWAMFATLRGRGTGTPPCSGTMSATQFQRGCCRSRSTSSSSSSNSNNSSSRSSYSSSSGCRWCCCCCRSSSECSSRRRSAVGEIRI